MSATLPAARARNDGRALWFAVWLTEPVLAWQAVRLQHWVTAVATGGLIGVVYALQAVSRSFGSAPDGPSLIALFVRNAVHMATLYAAAAALLTMGLAWLHQRSGPVTSGASAYATLIVTVAVFAGLLQQPLQTLTDAALDSFGLPGNSFGDASIAWYSYIFDSIGNALMHSITLLLATLCFLYVRGGRRAGRRLASVQTQRAQAERRALEEELAGAQATIEPSFLFGALELIERLFVSDAATAHWLLGELIAYLRAALPPIDGGPSTVGQQARLAQAYLQIERVRLEGRFNIRIDVDESVEGRSVEPLLLLPLATNAVRHGIEQCGGKHLVIRAFGLASRLIIEVEDNGTRGTGQLVEGAGLAGVRQRLVKLYGNRALLQLERCTPDGYKARIELPLEGLV